MAYMCAANVVSLLADLKKATAALHKAHSDDFDTAMEFRIAERALEGWHLYLMNQCTVALDLDAIGHAATQQAA